jgi:hypothetical protein
MPRPFAIALLLLAASPARRAGAEDGSGWEPVDVEGGVATFRRRDRPARLMAVSAVDARIEDVAEVLRDTPAFPGWLDACREATRVETVDAEHMTLHLLLGFPLDLRRDLVVKVDVAYDLDRARGTVDLSAVHGSPVPVPSGARRMRAFEGAFVLEYLGRERTGIVYTLEVDPDIGLPSFLVARATRAMLRNTVRKLGETARAPRYVEAGRRSRDRALFEALLADGARVRTALRNRLAEHFRDAEMIERLVSDRAAVDLLVRGDGHLAEALLVSGGSRGAREQVARAVLRVHARSALGEGAAAERLAGDPELVRALLDGSAPGRPSSTARWDQLASGEAP